MQADQHAFTFSCRAFGFVIAFFMLMSILISPAQGVLLINSIHSPFLDLFFSSITNLGSGILMIPCSIVLCFRSIYLGIGLVASGILEGIVVSLCKRVLFPNAGRPMSILNESFVHVVPNVDIHKTMSFPSGHTVTVFGICIFLALSLKNKYITIALIIFSSLVAISRVYLLQHFVIDIAVGSLIGTIIGVSVYHTIEQMKKPRWMNQRFEIKLKPSTATETKFS
jgi:membrane-associated phospholipid phosphatase